MNLTKEMKDLYPEHYKTFLKIEQVDSQCGVIFCCTAK